MQNGDVVNNWILSWMPVKTPQQCCDGSCSQALNTRRLLAFSTDIRCSRSKRLDQSSILVIQQGPVATMCPLEVITTGDRPFNGSSSADVGVQEDAEVADASRRHYEMAADAGGGCCCTTLISVFR